MSKYKLKLFAIFWLEKSSKIIKKEISKEILLKKHINLNELIVIKLENNKKCACVKVLEGSK